MYNQKCGICFKPMGNSLNQDKDGHSVHKKCCETTDTIKDCIEIAEEKIYIKDVNYCTFNFRRHIDIGDLHLDTLYKRLRWLFKGK